MVLQTKQDEPKAKPPIPVNRINIVVIDDEFEDDLVDIDVSTDQNEQIDNWEPVFEPDEPIIDPDPIRYVAEEQPSFPGGNAELKRFLRNNIVYPQLAREVNISGRVYLQFIVEKDGSITNIKLLKDIGGGCDEEAIRVVKLMPEWNPGKQNGRPVRVMLTLPVKFSLL